MILRKCGVTLYGIEVGYVVQEYSLQWEVSVQGYNVYVLHVHAISNRAQEVVNKEYENWQYSSPVLNVYWYRRTENHSAYLFEEFTKAFAQDSYRLCKGL